MEHKHGEVIASLLMQERSYLSVIDTSGIRHLILTSAIAQVIDGNGVCYLYVGDREITVQSPFAVVSSFMEHTAASYDELRRAIACFEETKKKITDNLLRIREKQAKERQERENQNSTSLLNRALGRM